MSGAQRTRTKSTQLVVLTALLVLLVPAAVSVSAALFVAPSAHPLHADRAFDHDEWMQFESDPDVGASSRLPMARALRASHALDGLTRADVEDLLGPPCVERWSSAYPCPGWEIGAHPWAEDGMGLLIEFDEEGRVRRVHTP